MEKHRPWFPRLCVRESALWAYRPQSWAPPRSQSSRGVSPYVRKAHVARRSRQTMPDQRPHSRPTRIAVIGNYVPRRCGIATFTADLAESLATEAPDSEVWAAAMNDTPRGYPYPSRVHFEVNEQSRRQYRLAAEFLNINGIEVASLQHEYGIFGGPAGGFILDLIGRLRMPVVTTLHTVLREPTPDQANVTSEIARLSAKLVVM